MSSIDLPASPADAWAFVVERGDEIEPLRFEPEGEQGVGVLNHLRSRSRWLPLRAVSRTTEWDPPHRCSIVSAQPTWPVTAHIIETFKAHEGGTTHTISYEVTPRGPVGRVVAPVLSRLMRRNRRQYQARLQAALRDAGVASRP